MPGPAPAQGSRQDRFVAAHLARQGGHCGPLVAKLRAVAKLIYLALHHIEAEWKRLPPRWHAAQTQLGGRLADRLTISVCSTDGSRTKILTGPRVAYPDPDHLVMPHPAHRNALQPDHRLQWYVIKRILGQGGFGITYLARDANLDQDVAIKEYLPIELAVREGDFSVHPMTGTHEHKYKWGLTRFVEEARTLARFDHPNVVRVYSVFEEHNTAYMVMRYERGKTLQEMLTDQKTLEEGRILNIAIPLLGALETIHSEGFIHRDIKPANIFIRRDGSPVLLDFGAARQAISGGSKSLTSLVSPGFAPIEQYYSKADEQGPWTDIYSLGATLYRCVAGFAPLDAIDRSRAANRGGESSYTSVIEAGAGQYSARLLQAIDHAVKFEPGERPQSVREWRSELDVPDEQVTAVNERAASADAGSAPRHVRGTQQRGVGAYLSSRRLVLAVAVVVVAAVAGFLTWRAMHPTWEFRDVAQNAGDSADGAGFSLAGNRSRWITDYGELDLYEQVNGAVSGEYPRRNGNIVGTLTGSELHGYWTEDVSDVACGTERDGSIYWGRVIFRFDDALEEFEGVWGYCDTALEYGWNGTRRR